MKFIFNILIFLAISSLAADIVWNLFDQPVVEVQTSNENNDESFDTTSDDDQNPFGSGEEEEEERKEKEFYYGIADLTPPVFQAATGSILSTSNEERICSVQLKPPYSPPELMD